MYTVKVLDRETWQVTKECGCEYAYYYPEQKVIFAVGCDQHVYPDISHFPFTVEPCP